MGTKHTKLRRASYETRMKAYALYLKGYSSRDIAEQIGDIGHTTVNKWIQEFKEHRITLTADEVIELNRDINAINFNTLSTSTIEDLLTIRKTVKGMLGKIDNEFGEVPTEKLKSVIDTLMVANNYLMEVNKLEDYVRENKLVIEVVGNESQ